MFERFTDRARRVVVLAQENARLLNHAYIGTEHLLLGLLHDDEGVVAAVFASLKITIETAREKVEEIVGLGERSPSGHIPFTPRSKKVIELAQREALLLGDNYIGAHHILLALEREGEGIACAVIAKHGVDPHRLRSCVIEVLSAHPELSKDPSHTQGAIAYLTTVMLSQVKMTPDLHNVWVTAVLMAGDGGAVSLDHMIAAIQQEQNT